jgi:hypothetical protein
MNDSLSFESFFAGAQRFVDIAMVARARADIELFALNAGVTIERLAKAALVRRNPALLVEMRATWKCFSILLA